MTEATTLDETPMTREYRFGQWRFFRDTRTLAHGASEQQLEPKTAELLVCFLEHPGEVLGHDRLINEVWDGRVVSDEAVRRAVSNLRQALEAHGNGGFIRTLRKKGYLADFPPPAPVATKSLAVAHAAAERDVAGTAGRGSSGPSETGAAVAVGPRQTGGSSTYKLLVPVSAVLLFVTVFLFWEYRPNPTSSVAPREVEGGIYNRAADRSEIVRDRVKSIAVLPFANLSPDVEQDYFAEGIAEDILNTLAQLPDLRVAARTSSFMFREDKQSIGEIADVLGVNHVLEGSVRKVGSKVRITAQLIAADTGYHLWSNRYDRELTDILRVQDEISAAIADALSSELRVTMRRQLPLVNPEAYEKYMRGRILLEQLVRTEVVEGVRLLEESIRLDPNYAPAHASIAVGKLLLTLEGGFDTTPLAEAKSVIVGHLNAAVALDPATPEVWYARAYLSLLEGKSAEALDEAEQALAISPSDRDALSMKSWALFNLQRHAEAVEAYERWLVLDPLSVQARSQLAPFLLRTNRERAFELARSIARQSSTASHHTLSLLYRIDGQPGKALREALLLYELEPEDGGNNFELAKTFVALLDLPEEARRFADNPWVQIFHLDARGEWQALEEALEPLNTGEADVGVAHWLATSLYMQERYEEVLKVFEKYVVETPLGPTLELGGGGDMDIWMAHALRNVGRADEAEAYLHRTQTALDERVKALGAGPGDYFQQAILHALRNDYSSFINSAQRAVAAGGNLRPDAFDVPLLGAVSDRPRVRNLRAQAEAAAQQRREAALALICEDNPVPDTWQPLQSTCSVR